MRDAPLIVWRLLLNSLGLRKSQKVFAVGFAKCATTSLHALFLSLRLPSFHGIGWRSCNSIQLLRTFDCFSDGIPKDLEKLDRLFPGSKFVLQVRDLQSWVFSQLAHIERSKKRGKHRALPDWDTTEYAVRSWILMRNRHHLFVQEYFADRPHDLLIVNFVSDPSAGTRVANFLGFPGNFDRPVENVNPNKRIPASHSEMLSRVSAELGIPAHELTYDIYCPSLVESGSRSQFAADTRAQSELQRRSAQPSTSAVA
jgi:hypothetical protein